MNPVGHPEQPNYRSRLLIISGSLCFFFAVFTTAWSLWIMAMDVSILFSYFGAGCGIYYMHMGMAALIAGKNVFQHKILIIISLVMGIIGFFIMSFVFLVTFQLHNDGIKTDEFSNCITSNYVQSVWCTENYLLYKGMLGLPRVNAMLGGIVSLVICCTRCRICSACYIENIRPGYIIQLNTNPSVHIAPINVVHMEPVNQAQCMDVGRMGLMGI